MKEKFGERELEGRGHKTFDLHGNNTGPPHDISTHRSFTNPPFTSLLHAHLFSLAHGIVLHFEFTEIAFDAGTLLS
jgi:hypothetical protein